MTNVSFLLRSLSYDELVGRLTMAGLLAHGDLAPFGLGLAANRRLALATTVGMVARIHGCAAHRGSNAQVAGSAGLTDADRRVLGVTDLAERGHAFDVHQADLARGQPHLGPGTFLGHQLRADACPAHHLTAAPWLELDVVDDRPDRDILQRERVARRQIS